ncbi:MAG TPA: hypothetical protein VIL09_20585 [Microvirga sp.]
MSLSHRARPFVSYPEARALAGRERAIALRSLMLQIRCWLRGMSRGGIWRRIGGPETAPVPHRSRLAHVAPR